jgi:hypothetical protein
VTPPTASRASRASARERPLALLRAFDRLENIPRDVRTWPAAIRQREKLADALAAEMDRALLYRRLATLIDDVPLEESLDDLRWTGVPRGAFEDWCVRVDAPRAVRDRVPRFE